MSVEQQPTAGREPHGQPHPQPEKVEIHVNRRRVTVIGHTQTGLQIKQAAIAQHVKIELDFLLFLEREGRPNERIADDQSVHVTNESRFKAIADDDNS
jgi:hypothetical protein